MSRFRFDSLVRLLRGDYAAEADVVASRDDMPNMLGIGTAVLVAAIVANLVLAELSWLEFALLVVVPNTDTGARIAAQTPQWFHRALAHERLQLRTAVDNIPQGLVLYDASARIVVCNKPYIEMFGLSPDVAKQGCTI